MHIFLLQYCRRPSRAEQTNFGWCLVSSLNELCPFGILNLIDDNLLLTCVFNNNSTILRLIASTY